MHRARWRRRTTLCTQATLRQGNGSIGACRNDILSCCVVHSASFTRHGSRCDGRHVVRWHPVSTGREEALLESSIDPSTARTSILRVERNLVSLPRSTDLVASSPHDQNSSHSRACASRSGLSQEDTSLVYSFFRLYYWPHLKNLPSSSTTQ